MRFSTRLGIGRTCRLVQCGAAQTAAQLRNLDGTPRGTIDNLPAERFSFIELTDEKSGKRLDRTPFAKEDIAIADKRTFIESGKRSFLGFLHPGPLAHILKQGANVFVRAGWKGARWLDSNGKPFDMLTALTAAEKTGMLDCPIGIRRKNAAPLSLRLAKIR